MPQPPKNLVIRRIRQFLRVNHAFLMWMLPFIKGPKVKFVIFAQGRTGSTLLVDLLNSSGDIRCDKEILNIYWFTGQVIKNPLNYVIGRAKRFRNEVYGFKVKIYQLENDHKMKDPKLFLQQLSKMGFKIIYLKRENVLEHSFSAIRRTATGITHMRSGRKDSGPINVPIGKLIYDIQRKIKYTEREAEVLIGMETLNLSYERDLSDSTRHVDTVNRVREYIGLHPVQTVKTTYTKINNRSLREQISNVVEVEEALKEKGLNHLLP